MSVTTKERVKPSPAKTFSEINAHEPRPDFGLALSGGGIRSATFNLGVLQGLARKRLLSRVDQLSTVSGGGYIGAWLLGLLRRRQVEVPTDAKPITAVEKEIAPENSGSPTSPGSKPIRFLREYSNYLTPEAGLFSTDTWAMVSIWLRNTLLNQMVLLPLVAATLLAPRIVAPYIQLIFGTKPVDPQILWHLTVFGPLLVVAVFSLLITLFVGIGSRSWSDESLEKLGAIAAVFNLLTVWWAVIASIAVYGPWIFAILGSYVGAWVHTLTVGWVVSTVTSLMAAKSPASGGPSPGGQRSTLYWIALTGPYIFAAGLLVFVSTVIHLGFIWSNYPHLSSVPAVLDFIVSKQGLVALAAHHWTLMTYIGVYWPFGALLAIALLFAWRVDINQFSMHSLYRNRLVRCYLGASRSDKRNPNWVGMDPDDDFDLALLSEVQPKPILNATLNLVHGDDLAWQERKGESFVFTPKYCGFERPPLPGRERPRGGFRETDKYAGGVKLGTAFATCGAAVNPSWGYHSSPVTSFLMAIFNVRLGQWFGNPIGAKWKERGPKFVLYWLKELFGDTNDQANYVELTDGGHFENLGIYELVRRRCRYIIASDADEDASYTFEDLAGALRKCHTDFGVEIKIHTRMIQPDAKSGWSAAHCAVGTIDYGEKEPGYLLYLKASLTGDEPEGVLEYHRAHAEFPHQSTADQWFDESQFESYRMLGLHAVDTVLENSFLNLKAKNADELPIEKLFKDLYDAWYPPSDYIRQSFTKHTATFDTIMERFRNKGSAALLSDFYDLKKLYDPFTDPEMNDFLLCNALIQLMENVFIDLHLDEPEQLEHPHNQGWIDLFKQWGVSPTFQKAWLAAAPTFGKRFRLFCHRVILLAEVKDKEES
jgi:hypothetical protein